MIEAQRQHPRSGRATTGKRCIVIWRSDPAKDLTGLIGRDELIEKVAREAPKGRHLLLTGPVGIGKSAVLGQSSTGCCCGNSGW
ncbi:MAG: ATP-binding protein [Candidatus Competibacteraceae bacterium]|nr:ATP-binding protein [Candidatus Competibacteraceae bacterium]